MMIHRSYASTALMQPSTVLGWRLPGLGFLLYSVISIAAHLLGARGLLSVGGMLVFLCVCIAWCRSTMAVRVDKTVELVLCILLLAIFTTLCDPTHTVFQNLLKHAVVCILYILIFSMELRPIYSTPFRTVFVLALLFMGVVSLIVPDVSEVDDVRRMSGFFVNANNLSLTMMTLLFLIDEQKDSRAKKAFFHAVIILFLILSGTSGAILAYFGAMLFKGLTFARSVGKSQSKLILVLMSIALIVIGCLLPARLYTDVPLAKRIVTQLSLVWQEFPLAASGHEMDYGRLSEVYGTSDCSGIWRISHWRACIDVVAGANTLQLLCGHGVGASSLLLYKVPHNDYLRVLMEQGILGLTLSLTFFLIVFRRIDRRYSYCIVAVALYCFSENNMDNLLFMSIFAFFLASAQTKSVLHPATSTG
jgi:O-antigen ligase